MGDGLVQGPERYLAIFQEAAVGIAQIAPDGHFLEVNETFCEMLGYPRADLLSCGFADVTHADDVQSDIAEVARLQRGEIASYALEKRFVRSDGRPLWTLTVGSAVRDSEGRLAYGVLVVHDIEKRKATEEALLRRNRQLALLSETAEELLMSEDPSGYLDQLFQRLAAHLDVQVYLHHQPRSDGQLQLIAQRGLSDELAEQLATLSLDHVVFGAAGRERRAMTLEDVQQSSDPRALAIRDLGVTALVCHPLVGRSGLLGTVAFGSRTRRAFDAEPLALIWAVCDQVVVAVERMRGELALREADRRKDEFLAMLAHELRNPLAAIHSAVQVVTLQQPNEGLRSAAEIMKRQLAHLTHLIDDLLDVARITQGKIKLETRRIELHQTIEQALETSRPIIESRGHRLQVDLPDERICVHGDPTRLAQVLSNLLSNAAKYTDKGGTVALSLEREQEHAVVRVRDTGIGISAEMLPSVFELFTQASPELDRAQGGLGVGLTLARALMRLHGGDLVAHSEGVGRGSEFELTLPLAGEAAEAITQAPVTERGGSPGVLRILVVDDNQDAAHTMAMLLRLDGHHVETAYDGPEALEAAGRFRPDVMLLDLGLPGLTGFEVARRLREQAEMRDVRLIALTGYGQEEDRRRTQEAGFDSHLVKPVDKDRLDEVLFETAHNSGRRS